MPSGDTYKSILLALGFLTYLLAGAAVFQALERGAEDTAKDNTERHRLDFLKNYTCLTKEALEHLVNVITDAVKNGIHPLENKTENTHSNWDLSSAFFFAGTVVTTIGYGTLAPRTPGGQIFCVFYALFGIPLNVIVLGHVGKILSRSCENIGKYFFSKGINKKKVKILTILFFLVTGIIVFLGIPPLVFIRTEHWTYTEGIYYAFISLSTIGFGDYVVGYEAHSNTGYRAFVCLWIIFGLAWLSLLFNLLTSLFEDTEKKIAKDLHKKEKNKKSNQQISMEPLTRNQLSEKEEEDMEDSNDKL
ncbi:potassium channel, subfamily K, member 16-like [Rhinophrynus dorsalis]